ncbi:MAG: T9SS type A sorting domain-containing protein [Flavobacteriales bacterium]|nr:T9SS type A sorting domain-containing protein [Flavobacteriales bacterium]
MLPRLTPILCLFTAPVLAQPIIQGPQSLPYVGLEHVWNRASNFIEPLQQGPDAVWDLSGLVVGNAWNAQWLEADPDMAWAYPNAPLHRMLFSEYWSVDGDSLHHHGRQALMNFIHYTDPRLDLRLPLAYGDTWFDEYSGESTVTESISGSIEAHASGYGTLILPSGVYENVIRLDLIDVSVGVNWNFANTDTVTRFYKQGYPWCLAEIRKDYQVTDQGASSNFWVLYMTVDFSTSIASVPAAESALRVYPNPTSQWIQIVHPQGKPLGALQVFDASGRNVHAAPLASAGLATASLDVVIGAGAVHR